MLKRIVAAFAALGFVAMLAGCNTMAGAGEDMQKAGQKVEKEADRHK